MIYLPSYAKQLVVVVYFSLSGNFDIVNDIAIIMVKSRKVNTKLDYHDQDIVFSIEICLFTDMGLLIQGIRKKKKKKKKKNIGKSKTRVIRKRACKK